MTRDEVTQVLLSAGFQNYVLELPTGMGKTKQAIELMRKYIPNSELSRVLILVPRLVLIQTWKDELDKWYPNLDMNITLACYDSIEKYIGKWDMIICDEAHHLTDRCMLALLEFKFDHSIFLSATLTGSMKENIKMVVPGVYFFKVSMKNAIQSEVLPEPTVYLLPLFLNSSKLTEEIIKNPKGSTTKIVTYDGRWAASKDKKTKYIIKCTQTQYHEHLCSMIEWYKKQYMSTRNEGLKHLWLRANLERLQWLSKIKVQYSIDINNKFIENNKRTLVFCSSIEQSEMFPNTKSIHSRNKESLKNLDDFNNGIINNITAVNSLNEGVNLVNCQIGIFNIINASEIMTIQKVGRILRHTKPILLIPYFSGTREEELVKDMMEHYSKESIKHILNVQQIIV